MISVNEFFVVTGISWRSLSHETGLFFGSCHSSLHKSLKSHPHRVSSLHEVIPVDFAKRLDYCKRFQGNMDGNQLDMTFFSDEAWIHLPGYLNSRNTRVCNVLNPHEFVNSPLHTVKIGVWMATFSKRSIAGAIFPPRNLEFGTLL